MFSFIFFLLPYFSAIIIFSTPTTCSMTTCSELRLWQKNNHHERIQSQIDNLYLRARLLLKLIIITYHNYIITIMTFAKDPCSNKINPIVFQAINCTRLPRGICSEATICGFWGDPIWTASGTDRWTVHRATIVYPRFCKLKHTFPGDGHQNFVV